MSIGTVGHVGHIHSLGLAQALIDALGPGLAEQVVIGEPQPELSPFAAAGFHGRPRNPNRKAERKARMRELQRRAFTGEPA